MGRGICCRSDWAVAEKVIDEEGADGKVNQSFCFQLFIDLPSSTGAVKETLDMGLILEEAP